MRIGIDISQIVFGTGVSDYTTDLVQAMMQLDSSHQFSLFGSSLRLRQRILHPFPQSHVFPFPPTFLDLLWNRLHVVNVENFIGQVDVFHSSDWTQPPTSCPKVTTVHDLSPFLFPDEMRSGGFRNIQAVQSRRMHWVISECDRIICVSQNTASDLKRLFHVPSSRIFVIPEALPSRFAKPVTREQIAATKSRYGVSDYVITIGTRQPRKNIDRLIKAFLQYKDKLRLPEKLVVVGGSGWKENYSSDQSVIFTGFVPNADLSALVSGAKVATFPSLYEGFGLPVLVAYYHQTPVVTSGSSALAEVAGKAAVLVNPLDTEDIAHGLAKAITNSRRLVSLGTEQLTKFSWSAAAQATLNVYSSLC